MHNVATNNEAKLPPIVEPLDIALPLSVLYGKKGNKRRLKDKRSLKKPDSVAADNNIVQDVTSTECQRVQYHLGLLIG